MLLTRRAFTCLAAASLAGCGHSPLNASPSGLHSGETPQLHALIRKYAQIYKVPESLFHRVIQRESGYNPRARNGAYYGLMQISVQTARGMGYTGAPSGLLDAETNLIYAGKYLRGAWLVSHGNEGQAVHWYSVGYYYEARRLGMLAQTGLGA